MHRFTFTGILVAMAQDTDAQQIAPADDSTVPTRGRAATAWWAMAAAYSSGFLAPYDKDAQRIAPEDDSAVRAKRRKADRLALDAWWAMGAAYLLGFLVLSDNDAASKLGGGPASATSTAGLPIMALASIAAAIGSVAAATKADSRHSSALTKTTIVLAYLAFGLFAPIAFFILALAFG